LIGGNLFFGDRVQTEPCHVLTLEVGGVCLAVAAQHDLPAGDRAGCGNIGQRARETESVTKSHPI
jgi:hypothetical protein